MLFFMFKEFKMRKTKIICTLGPASRSEQVIAGMLKSGLDVARINFSHGTHEYHKETIELFRKVRDKMGVPAAVMLDTKGPEIRLGNFKNHKEILENGAVFTLTSDEYDGDAKKVSVTYKDLPKQLTPGNKVLIDDGRIHLEVTQVKKNDIICKVISGGEVSDHKGVNIPNVHLNIPYLGRADEQDLVFGVEQDVDFIAASFVRSKEDVITLRNFLDYHGGYNIKIISKIENIEGVNNFDEILSHSDGIMVARGDMGVEIEFEKLPGLQKKFIRKCYQAGKMVITATQMLESMIHSTTPTRAEITDVANAVFDGTSAIMLSGETAIGDHPELVVQVMASIALQAEKDAFDMDIYKDVQYDIDMNDTTNAICDAACTTARDVKATAIIAITKSGYTARRVSKFRPREIIIATTPSEKTYHQLTLSWGVYPVKALYQYDANVLFHHSVACAKRFGFIKDNDRVVITAGADGTTDILKVQTVTDARK
ncbi:MAG TPA: pyruvate kinase [Clostridiales bacterium]|nr:pyruvate kinase [Clostridiales bacterium]HBL83220.1 pyruvate kinase [Clostridiales bacterium]